MESRPTFLQGVFPFVGEGLDTPVALDPPLRYEVPGGFTGQLVYFRGGNSSDELISVLLRRDADTMRHFPIGARDSMHVALRVVEDLLAGTRIEVLVAAPKGAEGTLVIDVGLVEV